MSWRDESNWRPTSIYTDVEKEFLKIVKKVKDILKLEEQAKEGALNPNQLKKIETKAQLLADLAKQAKQMPARSDLWEKHADVAGLLPADVRKAVDSTREKRARDIAKPSPAVRPTPAKEFVKRHDRPVVNVCVGDRCFYTCSKDKLVLRWEADLIDCYNRTQTTYCGHDGAVWAVGMVGKTLVSGGAEGHLLLWKTIDKKIGEATGRIPCTGIIKGIEPHPESSTIFATHADKLGPNTKPNITVWDLEQKKALFVIQDFPTRALAVAWGKVGAGMKIFSAHEDGTINVWSAAEGKFVKRLQVHTKEIRDLRFYEGNSSYPPRLLSASFDMTAKFIDCSVKEMPVTTQIRLNRPLNTAIQMGDLVVLGGGRENRDVTTSSLLQDEFHVFVYGMDGQQVGLDGPLNGGHFGPVHRLKGLNDDHVVSVGEDGCVKVIEMPTGAIIATDTIGAVRRSQN